MILFKQGFKCVQADLVWFDVLSSNQSKTGHWPLFVQIFQCGQGRLSGSLNKPTSRYRPAVRNDLWNTLLAQYPLLAAITVQTSTVIKAVFPRQKKPPAVIKAGLVKNITKGLI
jgi:hypothetical protein